MFNLSVKLNCSMPKKGREKNTKNKAKHNKLMNRKKNKLAQEKTLRKKRLKSIISKYKEEEKIDKKTNS